MKKYTKAKAVVNKYWNSYTALCRSNFMSGQEEAPSNSEYPLIDRVFLPPVLLTAGLLLATIVGGISYGVFRTFTDIASYQPPASNMIIDTIEKGMSLFIKTFAVGVPLAAAVAAPPFLSFFAGIAKAWGRDIKKSIKSPRKIALIKDLAKEFKSFYVKNFKKAYEQLKNWGGGTSAITLPLMDVTCLTGAAVIGSLVTYMVSFLSPVAAIAVAGMSLSGASVIVTQLAGHVKAAKEEICSWFKKKKPESNSTVITMDKASVLHAKKIKNIFLKQSRKTGAPSTAWQKRKNFDF